MKMPITWESGAFDALYATRNRINFARIWKTRDGDYQIAIDLPLGIYRPAKHIFTEVEEAKKTIETTIQMWFDQVDA